MDGVVLHEEAWTQTRKNGNLRLIWREAKNVVETKVGVNSCLLTLVPSKKIAVQASGILLFASPTPYFPKTGELHGNACE